MTGVVKSLLIDKRFGFIYASGIEYFFHRDDFNGHWEDLVIDYKHGKEIQVDFEVTESYKGPRAAFVSRLDFPNQAVK